MGKNLALFLDGTWNEPGDNTNVWRLKVMLASHAAGGEPQLSYYDTGVGTSWYNRLRGGTLGSGLSANVRQAYQWLVEHYDSGDNVFVFGFSRGAYTARSVTGMIVKCGLLYPGAAMTGFEMFERYQMGKDAPPIYRLQYLKEYEHKTLSNDEERLLANSRRIPIKMIGVWDTVGALGIPWTQAPLIGRGKFYFHNANLSKLYENAFHALAVDEHRAPYKPTLWTKFSPQIPNPPTPTGDTSQTVEQRWFIGAHSNVGGGYKNDDLAQIPLKWLQTKAVDCGLAFRHELTLTGNEHTSTLRDSFKEFMKGAYRVARFGKRYYRTIGAPERAVRGGTSKPICESIDHSVFQRYQADTSYRPKNLEDWARRKGQTLEEIDESVVT